RRRLPTRRSSDLRVREKDGRVAGVELADGSAADAEFVVAGAAPGELDRLCGDSPVRGDGEVPARRAAASRLTVLLALRGGRPGDTAHRTVVHAADREEELGALFGDRPSLPARPTVTVLRPDDPALVPDADHEAVTLSAVVPARSGGGHGQDAEALAGYAGQLIEGAERAVLGLRDRLLWHEVRAPAAVVAETGAPDGAAPQHARAAAGGRLLHGANSARRPGRFTVGGWSHAGGGRPHAGMSGALVARLILGGPDFRGEQ